MVEQAADTRRACGRSCRRRTRWIAVALTVLAAGSLGGCGSSASTSGNRTTSTHAAATGPEETSTGSLAAETAQIERLARIRATCAHRKALGSVESMSECEGNQQRLDEALERSQKTLEEGKAELEKLRREEASMTPAEKSRRAAEAKRAGTVAKELAQIAERAEAEAKQHKREHEYPPEAKREFLIGCGAAKLPSAVCRCWLRKVEARDTVPELLALSLAILHGTPIPRELEEDLQACKLSSG